MVIDKAFKVARIIKIVKNFPVYFYAYLSRTRGKSVVLKLKSGLNIKLRLNGSEVIAFNEQWVNDVYGLATLHVPPGGKILDLGANCGCFSLRAAELWQHSIIYAVEPAPDTFSLLMHNISCNNLSSRVRAINLAVAGFTQKRKLSMDNSSGRRSLCDISSDIPTVSVDTVTLRDLFDRLGLSSINLCKMDIEGAEHEVFATESLDVVRQVKCYVMEIHGSDRDRSSLLRKIALFGYHVTMLRDSIAVAVRIDG